MHVEGDVGVRKEKKGKMLDFQQSKKYQKPFTKV